MRNIVTIGAREFKSYLASPMAYIITAAFLIGTGVFFIYFSLAWKNETSMRGVFGNPVYIIIVLLLMCLLTMRLIAEEKKLGTIELLMTAPVRDSELVIGKFIGSVGVMLVMFAFTLYYPLMLFIFGDPDFGPIISSYLGLILLSSSALAVGIFASSVTSNQIVAAVVGGLIVLGLWYLGYLAGVFPASIADFVSYFSPYNYHPYFVRGIIDTRGVVYYLSIMALFLFLATRSVENSRWS
jgi:ABC-2 type transport system permease protein